MDENVKVESQSAVNDAKGKIVDIPDLPSKKEDIIAKNDELEKELDASDTLTKLDDATTALNNNIKQMEQITDPDENFVVERLTGLANITNIQAATEDNDPNGQLHKQGGYTSAVYFQSDLVDANTAYLEGDTPVSQGTDGGGCIEVYETAENATARDTYLAAFDGSAFSSGYHQVVGTIVIRVSKELTATQQQDMATNIFNSFIELK